MVPALEAAFGHAGFVVGMKLRVESHSARLWRRLLQRGNSPPRKRPLQRQERPTLQNHLKSKRESTKSKVED
jgi:hypothetical protein